MMPITFSDLQYGPTSRLFWCNSPHFRGQVLPTSGVCAWLLQSPIPGKRQHHSTTLATVAEWFEAGGLITGSSFHRGMCKKTVPLGDPKVGRVRWGIPKMVGTFGKDWGIFEADPIALDTEKTVCL